MAFAELKLTSWEDFVSRAKVGWIYRGQANSSWRLVTSLDRLCERYRFPPTKRIDVETALLRDFKRAFHQFSTDTLNYDDSLEWLATMQHHGAPSRLLDFTYSPYVAAYFALEDANESDETDAENWISIWAVSMDWLRSVSSLHFKATGKPLADRILGYFGSDAEAIHKQLLFDPPVVLGVMAANPYRLNERLRVQKGIFLAPGDVSQSFTNNLQAMPGHDNESNIVKFMLPAKLRLSAMETLHYMNISRTTLFPGLDGYAQSLSKYHHLFTSTRPWN